MKWIAVLTLFLALGCSTAAPQEEAVNKDGNAPLLMPTDTQCFPWPILNKLLFIQYREINVAGGLLATGQGKYISSFFTSEMGTWTFAITNPEGVSCILAYGSHWKTAVPPEGV